MKRIKARLEDVLDPDNLKAAIIEASDKKKKRKEVQRVLADIDLYAKRLGEFLRDPNPKFSPGIDEIRRDNPAGKERLINKPRFFPDHCAHWAVMRVVAPGMVRSYYRYSCSSLKGRGTRLARDAARRGMDDLRSSKYCLQMDVRHFYASIGKERAVEALRRVIKDPRIVHLLDLAIHAYQGPGLPLGWYPMAFIANLVLTPLDWFVKQKLGARHLVRYMDDMMILGPSKKRLRAMREAISARLGSMGLSMKGNWQVYRLPRPGDGPRENRRKGRYADFAGFALHRDFTAIRGRIFVSLRRTLVRKRQGAPYARRFFSYYGWIKATDSRGVADRYIRGHIAIKRLKEAIRNDQRKDGTGLGRARETIGQEARGGHLRA